MTQDVDLRCGVWVCPKADFEPYRLEFSLEIDAAASRDNALLPIFWTKEVNALLQDWTCKRIWCNPPYGRQDIYKWVRKCATGGGISLCCAAAGPHRHQMVSRFHLPEARRRSPLSQGPHQVQRHERIGKVPVHVRDIQTSKWRREALKREDEGMKKKKIRPAYRPLVWKVRIDDGFVAYQFRLNATNGGVCINDIYELVRRKLKARKARGRMVET